MYQLLSGHGLWCLELHPFPRLLPVLRVQLGGASSRGLAALPRMALCLWCYGHPSPLGPAEHVFLGPGGTLWALVVLGQT